MAFGGLIGEAFLRVRPDTSTFTQETRTGVSRALGGAGGASIARSVAGAGLITGALVVAAAGLRQVSDRALEDSLELQQSLEGLTGEASQAEGTIAHGLTPILINLADAAEGGASNVNALIDGLANIPVAPGVKLPDLFDFDTQDELRAEFERQTGRTFDAVGGDAGSAAGQAFAESFSFSAADALKSGGFNFTPVGDEFADEAFRAERADIERAGREAIRAQVAIVQAAQSTLRDVVAAGQDAVEEAIRQGNVAVQLSAVQARQNLIGIGQQVAADALTLLEEGPLARRIDQLQASLDRSQAGSERRQLRTALTDAERSLADAERQAQTAGPLTKAQQEARQRFLQPFRRDITDARDALGQFNTETVIGQLEAQAAEQRRIVQQGIADLIIQFNQGSLSVAQANQRLATLLEKNGVPAFRTVGDKLGTAFVTGVEVHLDALRRQMIEIAAGLGISTTGLEPNVVSPAGERRRQDKNIAETAQDAAARVRASQDALRKAQDDLRSAVRDNTSSLENLPDKMEAAVRAGLRPPKKPSVATGPGSSPDRPGGRTP